jgi:lipopolysaccharide transport system ATP-binding protein
MSVALRTERLGKRYRLRTAPRPRTLAEAALWRFRRLGSAGKEDFWALRDVSIEVAQGEVVGIVGRNGAGKSTLLKILAGITDPTEGHAEVHGRVGALLEVGTGFHPELSGRDNVYLNGAILGMKRAEIARKYDEIVEFGEVARFMDVPVKWYSSGMYVRLAFAVAAHLDPEILVVDEVLSVGDQAFQEKCLGRINEVTRAGRTVLFISHNMTSLLRLCPRGVLLEQGRVVHEGPMSETIDVYLSRRPQRQGTGDLENVDRGGWGWLRFRSIEITGSDGLSAVYAGGPVEFRLTLAGDRTMPGRQARIGLGISSHLGDRLATLTTDLDPESTITAGEVGDGTIVLCRVPELPLRPGKYLVSLWLEQAGDPLDSIEGQIEFEVLPADYFGTGTLPGGTEGAFLVRHHWQLAERPARVAIDRSP